MGFIDLHQENAFLTFILKGFTLKDHIVSAHLGVIFCTHGRKCNFDECAEKQY